MSELKISIITVCYNAGATIERCMLSVIGQKYSNIEYIVVDGGSTDGTLQVINKYANNISIVVSEPDNGIYDAMNKGIALASGEVIGTLNADDVFADEGAVSAIAAAFINNETDAVYADLCYVKPDKTVLRTWISGNYRHGKFERGWMPPHPTFYCKSTLFAKFGTYAQNLGSAADYELMARFIHFNRASVFYLPQTTVYMYTGGVSNSSYTERARVLYFDLKAMYKNGLIFPPVTLLLKKLSKVKQFF